MYVLVLVLVPFVEGEATLTLAMLLIVKLSVTKLSQPFAAPPTTLNVETLLLKV